MSKAKRNSERNTQILVASISAIAVIVSAVITGIFLLRGGDKPDVSQVVTTDSLAADGDDGSSIDSCLSGNVVVQGDVTCTKSKSADRTPESVTADAGCGSVEGDPGARKFQMHVIMWCAPEAVRSQYQYKLKLAVTNTADKKLDIRQERFALVWQSKGTGRWSAPPGNQSPPPRKVSYLNRTYWAIFANSDGVAEARPKTGDATFATHWKHKFLAPGKTSMPKGQGDRAFKYQDRNGELVTVDFSYHEDDLVFYVPVATVDREKNFLGLAYVDGNTIVALCPQSEWGPKVPPSYF